MPPQSNALSTQSMKSAITTILILFLFTSLSGANPDSFLYDFIQGKYVAVGKAPDTNKTYIGKITISGQNGSLIIKREINGEIIFAEGQIEKTTEGVNVLRVHFKQQNKSYECTYLIESDLDNYGRLTGYIYLINGEETINVGLEALFSDHGQLKSQ